MMGWPGSFVYGSNFLINADSDTHPLGEAYDWPHWAAEGAAAAEASAEQPPDVHGQSLAQRGINPPDRRLVLLGSHARVQGRRKLSVEAVRQPEPEALDYVK